MQLALFINPITFPMKLRVHSVLQPPRVKTPQSTRGMEIPPCERLTDRIVPNMIDRPIVDTMSPHSKSGSWTHLEVLNLELYLEVWLQARRSTPTLNLNPFRILMAFFGDFNRRETLGRRKNWCNNKASTSIEKIRYNFSTDKKKPFCPA